MMMVFSLVGSIYEDLQTAGYRQDFLKEMELHRQYQNVSQTAE